MNKATEERWPDFLSQSDRPRRPSFSATDIKARNDIFEYIVSELGSLECMDEQPGTWM